MIRGPDSQVFWLHIRSAYLFTSLTVFSNTHASNNVDGFGNSVSFDGFGSFKHATCLLVESPGSNIAVYQASIDPRLFQRAFRI